MRRPLTVLTASVAVTVGALAAGSVASADPAPDSRPSQAADAAPAAKRGLRCVKAGVRTLIELDLLVPAALRQVDYSTLADPVNGPIFTTLPPGSFLPLGDVIKLHVTDPELFAWCR